MSVKLKEKIWGYIRILRPEISTFGMLCVYIGAIAARQSYFSNNIIIGMLAVFFAGAGSMPFNDYFDYEIDKIAHPKRPIPSGIIKPIHGLYLGILFFIISLILSYLLNIICFIISVIGISLIIYYELSSKSQGLIGNIVVAFTTSMAFTYGGAIVGEFITPIFFTVICFLMFLGREILKDVDDVEGDRNIRYTLPMKVGKKSSIIFADILILISIIVIFIPVYYNWFNQFYFYFALIIASLTIIAIILPLLDVKHAGKSTHLLRLPMSLGLILFILAIIL
jgi:geranylgeranylglycerol-phosphate geranylgeranyltransferase